MNRLKNTSKEKEKLLKEIKDISRSISNHKKEQRREIYLKARPFIPIMIVMLFVVFSMFTSLIPTGLVAVERQFNYSDSIGLAVNNSQAYTWSMGDYGSLSSVKLDGSITKRGSARVYLEYGNNSYTVFDSLRLGEDGIGYITGSVVYDDTNQSVLENDTGETTGSESNSAGEKTIDAAVLGGGSKAEDEVFELNVESSFSWDVDYDKLCTRWSLTSSNSLILPTSAELNEVPHPDAENGSAELINDISSVSLCYGAEDCCAFIGMDSSGGWDSALHLSYGRYDSRAENTVSAQVIYYDVNLSIPYSEIAYSGVSSVQASFYEPRIEFKDVCLDTCLLPGLNASSYEMIFVVENATLNIDKIKYSIEKEVNVSENAPSLVNQFENITIYRNEKLTINLSRYFTDLDNERLNYSAYQVENITISINGPIATIVPDINFTGKRYAFFSAYDGYYRTSSNIFSIKVIERPLEASQANVSERLVKPRIVINRPVRWVKRVNVSDSVINLSVNISSHALNVTVRDVKENRTISEEKVKVNENGTIKNSTAYRAEKRIGQLRKMEERLLRDKEEAISERPNEMEEIADINEELIRIENEMNKLTGYAVAGSKEKGIITRLFERLFGMEIRITGYATYEEQNESSNSTSVIIEEIVEEVEIEYYTEAPISEEENISDGKRIVISSDVHYEDILAYTYLDDVHRSSVRLYWIINGSRELVGNVSYYDENNNSLIDLIEWVVPSLSNQTYEVEITVINVQSYPMVGGNWTVRFNTSGRANLSIKAVNGTTYGNDTPDDLTPLELRCGNSSLNYLWNGSDETYYPDYGCNYTGYWTVKVLTSGAHHQLFTFGEEEAYAHNWADNGSLYQYVDDCGILDTSNATYVLNASLKSSGTCLNIRASNITLDCRNYTITGAQNGYGINISGQENITVRNCLITNFTRAVSMEETGHTVLYNLTIYSNNGDYSGIFLNKSNYNNITGTNFSSNNASYSAGLYLSYSNYSTVENCTFSYNNVRRNGHLQGGGILGLYYSYSGTFINNTLENNAVNVTGSSNDIHGGGAIGLCYSDNNNFTISTANGNTITVTDDIFGGGVIGLYYSDYNQLITSTARRNNVTTTVDDIVAGVIGLYYSDNNILTGSTATDNNVTGKSLIAVGSIGLVYSINNTFTDSRAYRNNIYSSLDITVGAIGATWSDGPNTFINSEAVNNTMTTEEDIWGAGVIGCYFSSRQNFTNSTAIGNRIRANFNLFGSGVIGDCYSGNNTFTSSTARGNTVISMGCIDGGGVIGSHNSENSTFTDSTAVDNVITTVDQISGGGAIGVYASDNTRLITSTAINNTIRSYDHISGGGAIGTYGDDNTTLTNLTAINNTITASLYILGGGAIGIVGSDNIIVSTLRAINNTITTSQYITGGGAIGVHSSDNNKLTEFTAANNTITASQYIRGGGAIGIRDSNNNNLTTSIARNNRITANISGGGAIGLYVSASNTLNSISSTGNIITADSILGGAVFGMYYNSSSNIIRNMTLLNNNISSEDEFGLIGMTYDSDNNTLTGGTISDSPYPMIFLYEYDSKNAHNNNFTNLVLKNATKNAVKLVGSGTTGNRFFNLTINRTSMPAFNISNAGNTHIINNTFYNTSWDYYIEGGTIGEYSLTGNSLEMGNSYGEIKFLNTSLRAAGNNLSAVIKVESRLAFVNSSRDNGFNTTANITLKSITYIDPVVEVDWNDDGIFEDCPSNVCTNISTSGGIFIFNVTHFTSYRIPENSSVVSCGKMNNPNITYILINDVSSAKTCFDIDVDNITFDCNGYTITGGQDGYGMNVSGKKGITIRNCRITNFTRAIRIEGTNHSVFDNMTIYSNNGDHSGIFLNNSNYNNITNTNFSSNNASYSAGVYISRSYSNLVENCTFEDNNVERDEHLYGGGILGLYYSNSSTFVNNILTDNSVDVTGSGIDIKGGGIIGLYMSYSNNFSGSTSNSNDITATGDIEGGGAVGLYYSKNNSFTDSTASSNTINANDVYGGAAFGMYYGSSSNTVRNITIQGNSVPSGADSGLIGLAYNSDNNSFSEGTIRDSSYNLIYLYDASSNGVNNNNFTNLVLKNSTRHAVKVVHSDTSNNRFFNLTINGTTSAAFNISNSGNTHVINNTFYNTSVDYHIYTGTISEYSLTGNSLEIENIHGKIRFLNNSLYASGTNISAGIKITNSNIFVNTSSHKHLNTSANITLKSITYNDPAVYADYNDSGTYVNCPSSVCTELSYSENLFAFNVTHFTTYMADEGVSITLNKPLNDSLKNSRTVTFNYTAYGLYLDSCMLYGNFSGTWELNETNPSPDSGSYDVTSKTLENGNYIWNVKCNDTLGNTAWADNNFSVNVNFNYTGIILNSPDNGSLISEEGVLLDASVYNEYLMNVSFYADNDSEGLSNPDRKVYYSEDVADETTLTYNITALPVRSNEEGLAGLWRFDRTTDEYETEIAAADDMVLLLQFNNDSTAGESYNSSNGTIIYDYSNAKNNATFFFGSAHSGNYGAGKFGGAYVFDGKDDYINVSLGKMINFTIAMWVNKRCEVDRDYTLFHSKDHTFVMHLDNQELEFYTPATNWQSAGSSMLNNKWTLLTVASNETSFVVYTSGGIEKATLVDIYHYEANLTLRMIGSHLAGINRFNGTIDQFTVWNRTLSYDEVKNLVGNVTDSSGTGNKGKRVIADYEEGKFGNGLEFNNQQHHVVDIPYDSSLDITKNITVTAWIKPYSVHQGGILEKTIGGAVNEQYLLFVTDSTDYNLSFRVYRSNIPYSAKAASFPELNKWSHIAGRYDGSEVSVWLNGVKQDDTATVPAPGTLDSGNGDVLIGKLGSNVFPFNGMIDEVAVYNRSLTDEEIINHYHLGEGKYYWKVNLTSALPINESEIRMFIIDRTAPAITLNYPDDEEVISELNLNWTAVDNRDTEMTCNITIDGDVNASEISSPNGTATNYTPVGFIKGTYEWNVTCWDDAGNINTSETRSLTLDPNLPTITLNKPLNDSIIYNVLLNATVTDRDDDNMSVYFYANNGSGTFDQDNLVYYAENVTNGTVITYNLTALPIRSSEDGLLLLLHMDSITGYENVTVVDNEDDGFTNTSGWTCSSGTMAYSSTFCYASAGDGTANATWNFTVPETGLHNVYVWYRSGPDRATNTPFIIYHDDGNTTVTVNQKKFGSQWNELGNYSFTSGSAYNITITNNADNYVIADAIMVQKAGSGSHWNGTADSSSYAHEVNVYDVKLNKTDMKFGGGAFGFDGRASRAIVNDSNMLSFGNGTDDSPFSLSAWIRMDDAEYFTVISKYDSNYGHAEYALHFTATGNLSVAAYDDNWGNMRGIASKDAYTNLEGSWHHVAATYDGTGGSAAYDGMKLYIDGEQVTTNNLAAGSYTAMNDTDVPVTMGLYNGTPTNGTPANGTIDEAAIWNRTLSAEEILNHYSIGEGKYYWKVNASDGAFNNESEVWEFTVDWTAPNITLNYPDDGFATASTGINFNWTVTDNSDSNLTCNITLDGAVNISMISSLNGTSTNYTITGINDSTHYWNVTCWDDAGNVNSSETRNITIDTISPRISYSGGTLQTGSFVNRSWIYVNVSVTEINFANITFRLYNSTALVNQTTYNNQTFNINFTNLPDETYFYNVTVVDIVNNENSTETRNTTIDSTYPGINYAGGTADNNTYFNRDWIYINVSVTEANLANITFRLYNITGLVNETTYFTETYSINFTNLPDAIYYYNVTIVDQVNKENSTKTRNITLDTRTPQINYAGGMLPNGSFVSQSWIYVNVSVTEVNFANITFRLYNSTALVNKTTYHTEIYDINFTNLPDETYFYNVTVVDKANLENSTETRNTTLDLTYPGINYAGGTADNNTYFNRDWIYINVSVTEANFANITFRLYNITGLVNETTYFTETYSINFTNLPDAVYYYNVTITDQVNNENSTKTRNITLDTTASQISYAGGTLPSGSFVSRSWIYIDVSVTEINFANITFRLYNSTALVNKTTYNNQTFSINFTNLPDETYFYNVTVVDKANLENSTETRNVTLDLKYPAINYGEGTEDNNTYFNRDWIYINVSVTEANLANITFRLYNITGLVNETIYFTETYSINFTNLPDAVYYYNVTIIDKVSKQNSTKTRNITLDTTTPQISYAGGTIPTGSFVSQSWVYINVSVTETNFANITFRLYNSTALVNKTTYNNRTYSINFTGLPDEKYFYNVTVVDKVNLENSTETRNITLDLTFPRINYAGGTEDNNTYFNRDWIYINVSVTEINFANITFRLHNNTGPVNETIYTNRTYSINFTNLPDAVYYYNVTIIDKVNQQNSTKTRNITLDTTIPQISYAGGTQSDDALVSQNWVYINLSVTEVNLANITFRLYNSTGLVTQTIYFTETYNHNFTGLLDGTYLYNVTIIDKARNQNSTGTRNITLDVTPPSISLDSPFNNTWQLDKFVSLNYTATDIHEVDTCILYHNFNGTWRANYTNSTVVSGVQDFIEANLTNRTYAWNVWCNDTLGNAAFNATNFTFAIDSVQPGITINFPQNDYAANESFINFNWSITDLYRNTICNLTIDGKVNVSDITSLNGTDTNYTVTGFAEKLNNYWNLTCRDYLNNINTTKTRRFTVDFTAPWNISLFDPTPEDGTKGDHVIVMNWSVLDNFDVNITCYAVIDEQLNVSINATNGTYTNMSVFMPGGLHNISIRCFDDAGNYNESEVREYTVSLLNITAPKHYAVIRVNTSFTVNVTELLGPEYLDRMEGFFYDTHLNFSNTTIADWYANATAPDIEPEYVEIAAYSYSSLIGSEDNVSDSITVRIIRGINETTQLPSVTYLCPNETYILNSSAARIDAISDLDTLIREAVLRVNGTQITEDRSYENTSTYINIINYTYSNSSAGRYDILFNITDLENNSIAAAAPLYIDSVPANLSLFGEGVTNLTVRDVCSGIVLGGGEAINKTVPESFTFNLNAEFTNEPSIYFRGVNRSGSINITFITQTNITPAPVGHRRVAVFDIISNIEYSNYTLAYDFSEIAYTLVHVANLKLWKCNDTSDCNLEDLPITINLTEHTLTYNGDSLSRFMLTEPSLSIVPGEVLPPTINYFNISRTNIEPNETLNITVDFNVSLSLDDATLKIDNSGISPIDISNNGQRYVYNYNYSTNFWGRHNLSFVLLDANTFNDTAYLYFKVAGKELASVYATGFDNISLMDVTNKKVLAESSETLNIEIVPGKYDSAMAYNSVQVILRNFSVNSSSDEVAYYSESIDEADAPENRGSLKQFILNSSTDYSMVEIRINYGNISDIIDEGNLEIWKCPDPNNCTLAEINTSIDQQRNLIIANVTSLSLFMLAEASATETITVTSTGGAGGGGGGGSTSVVKETELASLNLINPGPLSVLTKEEVDVPIYLENDGELPLRGILVSVASNASNAVLRLSMNYIDNLPMGGTWMTILNIKAPSLEPFGRFPITIMANVTDPHLNAKTKTYLDIIDRYEKNKTQIKKALNFARDLFKENPECLEFNEFLEQAEDALENYEFSKSLKIIDGAIQACRDTIAAKEKEKEEELAPPIGDKVRNFWIFIIEMIMLLLLAVLMFIYMRKKARDRIERMMALERKGRK